MSLDTDFNVAPFWDDYTEDKNFHQVLFRAGVPVQARELTQAQTILQNQIERFGQNIFQDGTIISGSNFSFDSPYPYVKVLDLQADGQPVNISQYRNRILKNSSDLTAIVVDTIDGLESQNPNLNTLYVKYLNKGINGSGVFANAEVISAYTRDYQVLAVDVVDRGTGYSNNDIAVFTSSTGSDAAGRVITDNTGRVDTIVITTGGSNYISLPTMSIANSIGGTANGTGVSLLANNVVGQVTVAANTFVTTANTAFYPTGAGYSFSVGEGVIFQKGYFVRVEPQNLVISRYSTNPSGVQVGFETVESVVNNSIDTSLLDNAQGSPNETAPGAFRLKLTPKLALKLVDEAAAAPNFFSLVEFQDGKPIKQKQTSEYNVLGQEMAKRTAEESGNYVLYPFTISTDEISANTTHFQTRIGAGTAYVNGFRIEQHDTYSVPLRKGIDTQAIDSVSVSTNYGNYVFANKLVGMLPFNINDTVTLRDAAYVDAASTMGNSLGTARVRNVVFDNETNGVRTYRVYLFDIQMVGGASFSDTVAVFYAGTGFPDRGAANLVLEGGKATIKEASFAPLVFRFGQKAIKTLRDGSNNNDTIYTYNTLDTSVSFAANGVLQKNLSGTDVFPYSGVLNDIEERDMIFTARNSANTANYAGTVNVSTTTTTVVGTGTAFLNTFTVGDYFIPVGGTARRVISVANNTSMVVEANNSITNASVAHSKHFPANEVIPFTGRAARTITVSGSVLTAALGEDISNSLNINATYNVRRPSTLQLTKNINKNIIVKLNIATAAKGVSGPWSLGFADVHKLVSVTKTTNANYTTGAVDVTQHFVVDSGQKDTMYGLGYIRKKSTSKLVIEADAFLAVTVDVFTHTDTGGGIGFFSVDSYPVDDLVTPITTSVIRTQDIPMFTSPVSGAAYDLRDSVDFRPVVVNTATVATLLANATVNPTTTEALSADEKYVPAVNKTFITDLIYYQGRFDIISLTSYGQYDIKRGIASDNPTPPSKSHGAMNIATVSIPPFPTLTTKTGSSANRPDYTVKISTKQNRRYTMEDIGQLDSRLNRVEYYTALSLLEKQVSDLLIPSAIDPMLNRFKNGIFVEPYSNFSLSNVLDGEFSASIDEAVGELIPRFSSNKFDLTASSISGLISGSDIISLDYDHVLTIVQPFATRVRNCTENFWNFTGRVQLFPSYDNFYDVKRSPENTLVIDVDTAASTLSLLTELNNIRALNTIDTTTTVTSSSEQTSSVRGGDSSVSHWVDETVNTVRDTTVTETRNMLIGQVNETVQRVGDFITDISFSPYIREQVIHFTVTGLKPSTAVNAFFDKVKVTGYCQQAVIVPELITINSFKKKFALGDGLISDETGELHGMFFLPAGTFFVGDRELKFLDVNDLNSESAASTTAVGAFHAYNFSVTKSDVVVATRTAEVMNRASTSSSTSTTRDSTTRSVFVDVPTPPLPPVITPPRTPPVIVGGGGGGPEIPVPWVDDRIDWAWFRDRGVEITYTDPIAQTFSISRNQSENQDGIHISMVDLFFQRKDANLGITVQLRLTDNGYPSATVLPMASVHLKSNQVNVSANASALTPVVFPTPIFLKADQEYALVVIPDGNSPEYLIYTAQGGQTDLTNPSYTVRQDWGGGVLFTSTNNSAWQSIQDEDMKFNIHRAQYKTETGSMTLTNKDDEFFTVGPITNSFLGGEKVFKLTAAVAGNVTFNTNSTAVVGVGTSFQTAFTVGQAIVLCSNTTPAVTSNFDVVSVQSITNNTVMTLKSSPTFSGAGVKALSTPVGEVFFYDALKGEMTVTNSTASSNAFMFEAGDVVIGETLNGYTTITSVDDKVISYFQPLIYKTTMSGSNITGTIQLANEALQIQAAQPIIFNDTNYLNTFEAFIGSKSNEIAAGVGKSVRLTLNFTTSNRNISPTLDMQSTSILRYENQINNDSTNEANVNGNLISKYISKTITLKDGLDAEDIKAFVTGYQPTGTEIEVYVRALSAGDSDNLREKTWTKLIPTANTTSDSSNRNDFREFEYSFGNTVPTTALTGVVSVANNAVAVTGIGTLFTPEIAVGSVIQINTGSNSFVTRVSAVTSNTALTIADPAPATSTSTSISKLDTPNAMFRNVQNDGVVTYYNSNSRFETYKTFAIKIGLKSADTHLVPRLKDLRVIALSV